MILEREKLLQLGLKESPIINDQGLIYKTFDYDANDSYISIAHMLDTEGKVKKQIVTINDRELPKNLSVIEIQIFISIIS